ncbi:MAG: stage III sporulation protein AA [Defluviitaleaceae bacterium]|nr:stage III sporulation protein AA [Defluviitaleaceae bacterium]
MTTKENIRTFLGAGVAPWLDTISGDEFSRVSEIRLRAGKPMLIRMGGHDFFPDFRPAFEDIKETMERISRYSFYAFEAELSAGYITLPGGHRVGVSGQPVIENGAVSAWRYISTINIRVAHSVKGCADPVLPKILNGGGLLHTMLISPPAYGKTTLLRDIVRQISDGGITVGLADERSEIAGCFRGIPQNDVGIRTDIIDGCPKAAAMLMLLRGMSPEVIAVDELGGEQDARAVESVLNAGIRLLCTAHGRALDDVAQSPLLGKIIARGVFERFVVLDKNHGVPQVYDGGGKCLS